MKLVTLDDLAAMEGVTVAFEYAPDGKCRDYKSNKDVSLEMAAMITHYCALVTMSFDVLASAFSVLSEKNWVPQRGWMYAGGDHTVILGKGGYRGVFVETGKADVAELFEILSQSS